MLLDEKEPWYQEMWESVWFRVSDFWKNWIWPAYYLRNMLFNRYDCIKIKKMKPWEYWDVPERLQEAMYALLDHFIENENPEEHVVWYKDEDGNDEGPKYGIAPNYPIMFPEYKGMYIMDMIKEIYKWHHEDRKKLQDDLDYLTTFNYDYLNGTSWFEPCNDGSGCSVMKTDISTIPTDLSFFDTEDVKWDILDRYLDGDRNNLLKSGYLKNRMIQLEVDIENKEQKYLHLLVEVRMYMWT